MTAASNSIVRNATAGCKPDHGRKVTALPPQARLLDLKGSRELIREEFVELSDEGRQLRRYGIPDYVQVDVEVTVKRRFRIATLACHGI
jgi:hypothetical protein